MFSNAFPPFSHFTTELILPPPPSIPPPTQLLHHQEKDSVVVGEGTVAAAEEDNNMTPPLQHHEEYSSLFLSKMELKREQQQKSIDAYRSQSTTKPIEEPVYTALLSQVAQEFHKRITLSILAKDGIEHHDVFTGKEAVDKLLVVLDIQDRIEALEVGSALRSQGFFHDVNYEPVLKDSQDELYAFKEMSSISTDTTTDDELPSSPSGGK